MSDKERARHVAEILASRDPKRKAELIADINAERDPKLRVERGKEFVALVKARVADATRAEAAAAAEAAAPAEAAAAAPDAAPCPPPDAPHKALYEELKKDIDDYANYSGTSETHKTFPISDKLAASVARWPKVTEELVVYRGQSKKHLKLPGTEKPFFSATDGLKTAREFAGWPDAGNIFKITLKPGVRFLKTSSSLEGCGEQEIFVATDGVAEYGDKKVRVNDKGMNMWNMAIPVTIYPKPEGGRRTKRRRTRRRRTRRNV